MDWVQIAQTFGVPVAFLAVIVWGIWKTLTWCGENVVKPLVGRCLVFIDKVEQAGVNQTESMQKIAVLMEQHAAELRAIREKLNLPTPGPGTGAHA